MWLLPIVPLFLIRTVIGNLDVENNGISLTRDLEKPIRESIEEAGNQMQGDEVTTMEFGEDPAISTMETVLIPNPGFSNNDRKYRNKRSEEKKSPTFDPWGGKRTSFYGSLFGIRRPIRVPFNSWGGKRGGEYIEKMDQTKGNKFLLDWNYRMFLLDGLGVKRVEKNVKTSRKAPFNSWGGKRASLDVSDLDRRRLILTLENEINPARDIIDSQQVIEEKRFVSPNYIRCKPDPDFKSNSISMSNGKINYLRDDIDYKCQHAFSPAGGKRNVNNEIPLVTEYSGLPQDTAKGRKVFFSWGG